jgi:hypothetical protein
MPKHQGVSLKGLPSSINRKGLRFEGHTLDSRIVLRNTAPRGQRANIPEYVKHAPERREESMTTGTNRDADKVGVVRDDRERSTETKASTKTSEFFVFLAAVAAVLIASFVVDGFNATEGWMYFTLLSIGYMISRGLAKSGSREPYRD